MESRPRFEELTETTGIPLLAEAAAMMYTRYAVGGRLAAGKRVLELGCGAGQGFGLLGREASLLVGGDYSVALIQKGHAHYRGRYAFLRLSADALPFKEASFDLVLFFEASYYVPDMAATFRELYRITAAGGTVLIVNANPERPDFIRSPHSVRYHTADEFRGALEKQGFRVTVEGAFPVSAAATGYVARLRSLALGGARRTLEWLHLVPRTLRGRARVKRLVYRRWLTVPAELVEGFAEEAARTAVPPGQVRAFKVIYVTASRIKGDARNSTPD